MGIELAPGRTVRLDWIGGGDGEPSSRLAVDDDGMLLGVVLSPLPLVGAISPRGRIGLSLGRVAGRSAEGEVRIEGLEAPLGARSSLRLEGLICVKDGRASLEGFRIFSDRTDILVTGDLPLAAGLPPGRLGLEGVWEGHRLAAEGKFVVAADSAEWMPTGIRLGGAAAGPGRLIWFSPSGSSFPADGRLRAEFSMGGGTVLLDESRESPGAILVRGRALAFESVVPWLPFDLSGDWSALLDVEAEAGRAGDAWAAEGTAVARDGRVAGLDLLDEIGSLAGGAGRGVFRFREARTRWSYRSGHLFADSLAVETGKMKIEGAISYAEPDSLLGLLRLTPGSGSGLSSLLRLLGGGEGAIDLGIRGDPERPEVMPLNGPALEAWRDEVDAVRGRFLPTMHRQGGARPAAGRVSEANGPHPR